MFGYIKPCKPELKVKEFDTFKAVYCGLCKQLSHVFGPFASLTLSYDFTFVAIVSLALKSECAGFRTCSCVANPFKKKACLLPCDDLTYSASVAMLLIYYKVKDDIADSGFFRRLPRWLALPFASSARRKAKKLYPELDAALGEAIARQSALERESVPSPDAAADPTASALASVCERLSDDEKQKTILRRFGYLLGRYCYFADALDDLEKDQKSGGYNPFLQKFAGQARGLDELRDYGVAALNLTVGELAPAYELLELRRYKSILDNIIYLGLHQAIRDILEKPKAKHPEPAREIPSPERNGHPHE